MTGWQCEGCGASGEVDMPEGIDVYGGVNLLRDAHNEASPECLFDLGKVRVSELCGVCGGPSHDAYDCEAP